MREIEKTLLAVAFVCLGFCSWVWLDVGRYQLVEGWRLEGLLGGVRPPGRTGIAAITRAEIERSGLIGRIEIPRLGLSAIVAEGTDGRTLRHAVGHVSRTALPGETGNVALAGHRDTFFRGLSEVRQGDRVRIITPDGRFVYRVESKNVVGPENTEVLASSATPTLTLITCYPFQFVGAAPERYVVRAREIRPIASEAAGAIRLGSPEPR